MQLRLGIVLKTPEITTFRKLRWEDHEFETRLSYRVSFRPA
jgi:hypothetical protein